MLNFLLSCTVQIRRLLCPDHVAAFRGALTHTNALRFFQRLRLICMFLNAQPCGVATDGTKELAQC